MNGSHKGIVVHSTCGCDPDITTSVSADGPYPWQDVLSVVDAILFKYVGLGAYPAAHLHQSIVDIVDDVTVWHAHENQIVWIFLGQIDHNMCVMVRLWAGGLESSWCG